VVVGPNSLNGDGRRHVSERPKISGKSSPLPRL
jgi:hypothetical protein